MTTLEPPERPPGPRIRVLLVDDQEMIRDGLAVLLTASGSIDVVGQASNGAEAIEQTARLDPDVIVMDIRMPGMDGLAATAAILGSAAEGDLASTRPKILILTTFDHDDYVYEALQAGASGFLLKDAPARDLVHAIDVVARGDALLAPSVTRRLIADLTQRRRPVANPEAAADLTGREREVLRMMAGGLSNAEIAATLTLSEQTIKTHVGHILAKLGLRDRTQAVVFAYEHGMMS